MTSVAINTGAQLSQTFRAAEATIDADGSVTVTATDLAGDAVSGPATATHSGAANSGLYTWALAPQDAPDVLTITWAGTFAGVAQSVRQTVQIVGGFYFPLYDLRHADDQQGAAVPLADPNKWPEWLLQQARDEAEAEAIRIMGHSCVPRAARERMVARRGVLAPSRNYVRAVRSAVTAWDSATVDVSSWRLEGHTSSWIRCGLADGTPVTVVYEHGEDEADVEVGRACMVRARHGLYRLASRLPEATERYNVTEHGTILLSSPTSRATGNAYVDAVYSAHSTQVGFA